MAHVLYANGIKNLGLGNIDFEGDTIKAMLVTSAYTPNEDTDEFASDVTNEVSGTGYTAGGATLANCSVSVDSANNRVEFDADNPTWTGSTITARGAVILKDTGVDTTSPLLFYVDFGEDKTSTDGAFTPTINSEGIGYINYTQA